LSCPQRAQATSHYRRTAGVDVHQRHSSSCQHCASLPPDTTSRFRL
jgi:hypothetical protein